MRRLMDSWMWLLVLFTVAGFLEAAFWGQMSAFTPLYLPRLGVPPERVPEWTGLITALAGFAGLPFLPFWGALADRYARRPIIVRSFIAHLLAGVVTMLAPNVWVFVLGRSLMSLSLGNTGLMMTTLSERVPPRRQGLAFAIMNTATPVGVFVGPLAGGPLVDAWGFPALLGLNSALMLMVVLALSFGYADRFRGSVSGSLLRMAAGSVNIIWGSLRLRVLFAALFVLFSGWILAITYVPVAVTQLYTGDDPGSAVGVVMGAGGLLNLVLGPIFGTLSDRYGHWRVVVAGALLSVALWPLPALMPGLVGFAAAWAVLNGVVSSVFAISFTVLAASAAVEVRGRVMSFAYLPVTLGGMLGPALGSLVTRASVFAVFPLAAVLTLAGVGMLVLARRQRVEGVAVEGV